MLVLLETKEEAGQDPEQPQDQDREVEQAAECLKAPQKKEMEGCTFLKGKNTNNTLVFSFGYALLFPLFRLFLCSLGYRNTSWKGSWPFSLLRLLKAMEFRQPHQPIDILLVQKARAVLVQII